MPGSTTSRHRPPLLVEVEAPDTELAQALAAMGLVSWLWDLTEGRLRWTGDLSPLLGQLRGRFSGHFAQFLEVLHPDDVQPSRERMLACIRGQLTSYLVEERVRWPDGQLRWLETCGHVRPGPDGRAERMAGVVRDVTPRRQAQRALEDSEARLRRLIDDAPVAIGMSRGGRVLGGNAAFARLYGASSVQALVDRPVTSLVAPHAAAAFEERTRRRAAGSAEPTVYEGTFRRLDGSEFPGLVSVSVAALHDGPAEAVYVQDLSDTTRQRLALQFARDRAEQYLRIARSIQLELDAQGRIASLNERGYEVLGHAPGELVGRNWFDGFRPPAEVAAAKALFAEVMNGTRPPIEEHESAVVTRSGAVRHILWRNGPLLDTQGRICGLMSSGEDVTERRNADEALRALAQTLEQRVRLRTAELEASNRALEIARNAAEAGTRAKGEFLAHMSHEIRTPMNAVIGLSHLALQQPDLPPRAREYLGQIRRAADALLAIINDVLDFSRIESGRIELSRAAFTLDEMLERVTALVAQTARSKGLEFVLHTLPDVPRQVVGDALRLGQVLTNLCGNAVKFTERGQVVMRVERLQPHGPAGTRLRFTVRDTGIGIEPALRDRLFQPFEQLDASITRRFGGTGLGLAISRQLVGLMGGHIELHSEPGRGSEFAVTVDLGLPDGGDVGGVPQAPASATRRCLVVDAGDTARRAAADLCLRLGLRVSAVPSVAQAMDELSAARRQGDPYGLLLVDGRLADAEGPRTATRVRRRAGDPPPCLVRVAGPGVPAASAPAPDTPFDAELERPLTASALLGVLQRGPSTPVRSRRERRVVHGPAAPVLQATPALRGRHLLLVEDNELNQVVATDLLQDLAGARVTLATTGLQALALLRENRFDAVLMDLQMPDMDGFEVTRQLRADERLAGLPVIAMTAHALARDRERCLAVGMDDFVGKPIDPAELFAVLGRLLDQPSGPHRSIDHGAGLQRCLGRPEVYSRVLALFVATRGDDAGTLRRELEAGDLKSARRRAHTMISSAATVGADALSDTARQLMNMLEAPDPTPTSELIDRLTAQLEDAVASSRSYLRSVAAEAR